MRIKLAAVLAVVLFAVLAGGGVAQAYWLSQVSASSQVEVASLASNCTPATRLTNGSFESPIIPNASYLQGAVSPWSTTDPRGIELWSSGFNSVPAQVGRQFVELNAESAGTLWQDIATTPGQTIRWSLVHRAREGVDTMRVSLGPVGTSGVSQGTYSATTAAWVRHEGTYTVPIGQTTTRFSMTAVSTGSGNPTIGNFIDDVSFGSGPCLTGGSTVTNTHPTRTLAAAQIGDELSYVTTVKNTGGSLALNSIFTATLPAGVDFKPGSVIIDGASRTDAAGDDQVQYAAPSKLLTARLGLNADTAVGGSIAPDQTITISFRAIVTAAAVGNAVTYAPLVGYHDYLAPSWPQTATIPPTSFTIVAADLAVAVLSTPTVTVGANAAWTFALVNNGPSPATDAKVTVTVPAGLTNVTVVRTTANGGTGSSACTGSSTPRTCSIGTLNSGDTRIITLSGRVNTPQPSYVSTATASTSVYDHVGANDVATNTATIPDNQAPSSPGGLNATGTTASQTTIRWTASTDNVGVAGYDVYRDGVLAGTTPGLTFTDTGLDSGTRYRYTVVAFDAKPNRSSTSSTLAVFTTIDSSHWYTISYPHGDKCVGTTDTSNNTGLKIVNCAASSTRQQWRFAPTTVNGYYYVIPRYDTDMKWDIVNPLARVSEVNGNADDQRWRPIVTTLGGNSYLGLQNRAGSCLDAPGSTQTNGAQLQQYTCNATTAQSFLLTKVP